MASALASAVEAVRKVHSYEEHVIYVTEGFATRADPKDDAKNPNSYFNRNQNGQHPLESFDSDQKTRLTEINKSRAK